MSMILEDLDFVEVDLNNMTFTHMTPIPESLMTTPKSNWGGDKNMQVKIAREKAVSLKLDVHVPTMGSNTSRSSLVSVEERTASLGRRVLLVIQRLGQALGTHFTCKEKQTPLDDNSSLDGHLFEYAMHVQTEPRVIVPRLHLKPTCRERAASLVRRIFLGCARSKQSYSQSSE